MLQMLCYVAPVLLVKYIQHYRIITMSWNLNMSNFRVEIFFSYFRKIFVEEILSSLQFTLDSKLWLEYLMFCISLGSYLILCTSPVEAIVEHQTPISLIVRPYPSEIPSKSCEFRTSLNSTLSCVILIVHLGVKSRTRSVITVVHLL